MILLATINAIKRKDLKTPKWQYDVHVEGLPRKRQGSYATKKEALAAGQLVARELEEGIEIQKEIKFEDYFNTWVKVHNKTNLSKNQYAWYVRAIKMFTERFGENKLLKNITKSEYQLFLNEYGEGRTTETVRKVHSCLSPALKDAVYEGYLERDPTYKVKVKGTKAAQNEEDKYVTKTQYFDLIKYFKTKNDLSYILLFLIAITGARFSEVNQITWKDLNKAPGIIHLPGTKNDTAARDVEVSKENIELAISKLATHPRKINGKLFDISNTAASKSLKVAMKNIGMIEDDWITIYGLRHTHCSVLYSEGIKLKYISHRLGHNNLQTTMNTYSHLLKEDKSEEGAKARSII